jgi:hypothetical protein
MGALEALRALHKNYPPCTYVLVDLYKYSAYSSVEVENPDVDPEGETRSALLYVHTFIWAQPCFRVRHANHADHDGFD